MASDNINHYDYYNHNVEPNATVNPNKKGPLWNANNNKQISCCIDNSINKNVWKRLNPDIADFDKRLDDIEKEIDKPELKLPVNGYKSQIVARYLCIDGDDGNGTSLAIGNVGFILNPHWYYESAGGNEYGMVALRIRDIGYMGTICRYVSGTTFNDVPSSVTMINGETIELECKNSHTWTYKVKGFEDGARLPIWPMIPNFAITKIKFYHIPYDERAAPYLGTRHGSYKDLLYSIPFPYDRYDQCTVTSHPVPTGTVVGWKPVSIEEFNNHWDMRKYVDTHSNTYYIPITNGSKPYNYTDLGLYLQFFPRNGYTRTFADVHYEGEFISPKKMNDKSNKEYAVSLFYAYTGRTNYKANNSNRDIIRMPYDPSRTLYNIYGFCLYTIQEFYNTNNRYPNLMEGTPDYIWCLDYLKSKVHNLHNDGRGLRGDLYVYINDDGKYAIDGGNIGSGNDFFILRTINQPTNSYSHNYRI